MENRLIRFGKNSSQKLEQKRKEKVENEENLMITLPSRPEDPNFPERLMQVKKNYEKKLIQKKIEMFEQESKLIKNPQICKKSEEIVQSLNRDEKVEERLYKSAKKIQEKIETKKLIQAMRSKLLANPKISPLAKKISRTDNISDRLLEYKNYYDQKLIELTNKYSPPRTETRSKSSLVARQRLLKQKSFSSIQQTFSFKPCLNPNSLKIAKKLEKSSQRLLKTPSPAKRNSENFDCFFKPEINPYSALIDCRKSSNSQRWKSLYQLKDLQSERKLKISEELNILDSECTFKPNINSSRSGRSSLNFVEKVYGWRKLLDDKIHDKRKLEIKEEIEKCTFSPDIKRLKLKKSETIHAAKKSEGYSKKFQQMSTREFLSVLEDLY